VTRFHSRQPLNLHGLYTEEVGNILEAAADAVAPYWSKAGIFVNQVVDEADKGKLVGVHVYAALIRDSQLFENWMPIEAQDDLNNVLYAWQHDLIYYGIENWMSMFIGVADHGGQRHSVWIPDYTDTYGPWKIEVTASANRLKIEGALAEV